MGDVVIFTPKYAANAQTNYERFINFCKHSLQLFEDSPDFDWKHDIWPGFRLCKGSVGVRKRFTESERLDADFIDFAKAYYRYNQSISPTVHKKEREALKVLEQALLETLGSASIVNLNMAVLQRAVAITKSTKANSNAYHVGNQLQNIAHFVTEKGLVARNLMNFVNPIKRADDSLSLSPEREAKNQQKLPPKEGILAISEIFAGLREDSLDVDIYVASVWVIHLASGLRLEEVNELSRYCEVENFNGIEYGLRYYSRKNGEPDIRSIQAEMIDVTKKAIQWLVQLSKPARRFARFLEVNKDLKTHWVRFEETLDKNRLQKFIAKFDGISPSRNIKLWQKVLRKQNQNLLKASYAKYEPIKWSEGLMTFHRYQLDKTRTTNPLMLWKAPKGTLGDHSGKNNRESIFERFGYAMSDGARIKMTSHMGRHNLHTILVKAGLSEDELMSYFKRNSVRQNRVYNHLTEAEKSEQLSQFTQKMLAPKEEAVLIESSVLRKKMPAHETIFGICRHDFTNSPCLNFRNCFRCYSLVVVKGHLGHEASLREGLKVGQSKLNQYEDVVSKGHGQYDKTYFNLKADVEILEKWIELLDSEEFEAGDLITLSQPRFDSPINRVIDDGILKLEPIKEQISE